jgi:hypothetical protein
LTVSLLQHFPTVGVNIEADGAITGGFAIVANDVGGTHYDPQDAADEYWALVKAMYSSSTTAPSWELQHYTGGVFVPVASGACAGGAGTGSTNILTSAITVTFKDDANVRVNFQFPETGIGIPLRQTHALAGAAIAAFSASVLDTLTPGKLGYWALSRKAEVIVIPRLATGSQNRRLRKLRGFA